MKFSITLLLIFSTFIAFTNCWPDFYFYPQNGGEPVKLSTTGTLNGTQFNYSKTTSFVVHGFSSAYNDPDIVPIRVALLTNTDANIIVVDWAEGAKKIDYPVAFLNQRVTGKNLSIFILTNAIDPSRILCVGHSLGAHACGFAGKNLNKLSRIIGLDPAGPLFDLHSADMRLNSTDATLVDVIHTTKTAGIVYNIGHKDFWPNHGDLQPGCEFFNIDCGHERSVYLFIESTRNASSFASWQCTDGSHDGACTTVSKSVGSPMGYFSNMNSNQGNFFLRTNSKPPFSKN